MFFVERLFSGSNIIWKWYSPSRSVTKRQKIFSFSTTWFTIINAQDCFSDPPLLHPWKNFPQILNVLYRQKARYYTIYNQKIQFVTVACCKNSISNTEYTLQSTVLWEELTEWALIHSLTVVSTKTTIANLVMKQRVYIKRITSNMLSWHLAFLRALHVCFIVKWHETDNPCTRGWRIIWRL